MRDGDLKEAARLCDTVLNEDPDWVPALFCAARLFIRAERHGLAYVLNRRCTELMPAESACWNNAGMCAAAIPGRDDEAERMLRKAIKLDRGSFPALNNMALVMVHKCQPEEAIKFANASLEVSPGQPDVLETRGYAYLMKGDYANGWDGYEAMVGNSKYRKEVKYKNEPRWRGETGGRLILREEQGVGDMISFASILPDAMQDNDITLECSAKMAGLMRRSFPGIVVHGTKEARSADWVADGEWDYHALIGSLAWKYRRTAESFPGKPFLVPDPERVDQWKLLLDRLPGLKVGIAWTGGLHNTFKHRRSLSLETLAPILKTPGCSFVSLQYRDPTEEIKQVTQKHGVKVHHWPRAAESQDYDDVVALIAGLDLVISVTTAAVDGAGAIGKECWALVPSRPHWRYGLEGDRKVWYESVRLYRQRGADWGRVVEEVAGELRKRCSTSSSESTGDSR